MTLFNQINQLIIMNKSILFAITALLIVFYNISCTAQENEENKSTIKSEKYEPCCGTPSDANREIYPGVNVFIPNVFTPNGDGINDFFYPVVDTSIVKNGFVQIFTIWNSDDVKTKKSLYHVDFINYNEISNYAFNGKYYNDSLSQWKVWEGKFWYSMLVIIEGKVIANINGSACSIVCDDEAPIFRDKQGCFFPAQVKNFVGDNKISNLESDCFK